MAWLSSGAWRRAWPVRPAPSRTRRLPAFGRPQTASPRRLDPSGRECYHEGMNQVTHERRAIQGSSAVPRKGMGWDPLDGRSAEEWQGSASRRLYDGEALRDRERRRGSFHLKEPREPAGEKERLH